MKLISGSKLGLRTPVAVCGPIPAIGAAAGDPQRLGAVDNTLLRNPVPTTSRRYGVAMTAGDFNNDNVSDLAIVAFAASEVHVLFGVEWEVVAAPPAKFTEMVVPIRFQLLNAPSIFLARRWRPAISTTTAHAISR